MLSAVNRKTFFAELKAALGVRSWTSEQVDGLTRFLDEAERDAVIPSGQVGLQRAAYWIYTMWIETARRFQPIHEYGGRAYFIRRYGAKTKKGRELGNDTDEEAVAYSGVGLVQTTGENNVERLEAHIREHYPTIAAAVERDTGKPFDLTIGDQPDDRADVENMTRFDVAYVALVAGTTFAFYGPPLSRYISAARVDYKGARRCVNGTDRNDEFAKFCPKIERALLAAAVADTTSQPLAAFTHDPAIASGGEPLASVAPLSADASGQLDAPSVSVVNAAPAPDPAQSTVVAEAGSAVSVVNTDQGNQQPQAVAGGAVGDPVQKVTAGSNSWARQIVAWISTLVGAASGYVRDAFGLTPEIQRWLLVGVAVLGVVWLVARFFAERQVRELHADVSKVNVK